MNSAGRSTLRPYTGNDTPRATLFDINGTAFDDLMLDVDRAVRALPPALARPITCYFVRDMGRDGTARACGISVRTLDGRLNLAYHHIARLLNPK